MRHNYGGRKLNRNAPHRRMLYRNLVTALFEHERIETTVQKAKEARILAEKLITFAKRGDLHARRQAARKLNDPAVLQKLFDDIGPRYTEREGGYTRIMRMSGLRKGDGAEMAILELVDSTARLKSVDSKKRTKARRILKAEEKAEAKAALQEAAEDQVDTVDEVEAVVEETAAEVSDHPLAKKFAVDDLKIVEGVGPKIEELLKAGGFGTWSELAEADPEKIREILEEAGSHYKSHDPTTWPKQAGMAAAGEWDKLQKWQDELDGGKEG